MLVSHSLPGLTVHTAHTPTHSHTHTHTVCDTHTHEALTHTHTHSLTHRFPFFVMEDVSTANTD